MRFRDYSLKLQLTLLTTTVSVVALLAALLATIAYDIHAFRDSRFEQLDSISDLISFNAEAALAFDNAVAVEELLSGLASQSFITHAELRSKSGKILAKYTRRKVEGISQEDSATTTEFEVGRHLTEEHLILVSDVRVNGERKGTLAIFSDLDELQNDIKAHMLLLAAVLLGCLILATLLSLSFQRLISAPLDMLLSAISRITSQRDYSARVSKDRTNEFGMLIDSFNSMLAEIEARDRNLEQEVTQRTRELSSSEEILERLVQGEELHSVLDRLAGAIEGEWPGALCSFLLPNQDGDCLVAGAAPSLPDEYVSALGEVPIADGVGSCGSAAAIRETVIVEDISTDPRWRDFRELALQFGLRACWSAPILSSTQELLGTIALYYKEVRRPSPEELERAKGLIHLTSVVLEHHRTQSRLLEERDRAEAANEAKGQFLANMSHEIRTPMNGVLGMADLLVDTQLDESQLDMAKTIQDSGTHLLRIIDDILDFSKMAEGKMELHAQPTDLMKLGREMERLFAGPCAEKDISFVLSPDQSLPPQVMMDDIRLKQILVNLIGNAVKFTPNGGEVELGIHGQQLSEEGAVFEFSVSDTGVGISEQHKARIFEEFAQADGTVTREFGGTGLGLAISKNLVGLFGGELTLQSEKGYGSKFSFAVPVDLCAEASKLSIRECEIVEEVVPCNILVAEDNKVNQKLIVRILEKMGHTVFLVSDGAKAVDAFNEGEFDIVLLDIQMPVMGGEEALQHIRARPGGESVPVLAITAHAMKGDKERYLEMGMNGYVSKPIQREQLLAEMSRAISNVSY